MCLEMYLGVLDQVSEDVEFSSSFLGHCGRASSVMFSHGLFYRLQR